jgi:hypothetical protein
MSIKAIRQAGGVLPFRFCRSSFELTSSLIAVAKIQALSFDRHADRDTSLIRKPVMSYVCVITECDDPPDLCISNVGKDTVG